MSRADLLQLRDRLRAAAGPDYELSGDIALDVAGWRVKNGHWWRDPVSKEWVMGPPHFTGNLESAATLVSKGALGTIDNLLWQVGEWRGAARARLGDCSWSAATPALALCLARVEYEIAKTKDRTS